MFPSWSSLPLALAQQSSAPASYNWGGMNPMPGSAPVPGGMPGGAMLASAAPIIPDASNRLMPMTAMGAPGQVGIGGAPNALGQIGDSKPSYLNTPMSQWTGDMFEAYKTANAPSQIPGYINMGLQGVTSLGQLGLGLWGLKNASEAFNFQKGMAEKNYANQLKSYNTAVEDRTRGKYSVEAAAANKDAINAEVERKKLAK